MHQTMPGKKIGKNRKENKVVALGDICIDIKTDPLSGFTLGDRQFRVEGLDLSVGGNSANFCMGTSSLGLDTSLMCCLGKDAFSDWLAKRMRVAGVKLVVKKYDPGTAAITYGLTHSDGTRQMVTYNGPNLALSIDHVDYKLIRGASSFHRSGFWWSPKLWDKSTARIMRYAQDCGAETTLDIATDPEGWPKHRRELVYPALEHTDIFFANDTEVLGLTGKKSISQAADAIIGMGTRMVALHYGKMGSVVFTKGAVVKAPAYKIAPKNPIGSGDIFNAGFVYARSRGLTIGSCAKFANACAAYYLERLTKPYPAPAAIQKRFSIKITS